MGVDDQSVKNDMNFELRCECGGGADRACRREVDVLFEFVLSRAQQKQGVDLG